VLGGFVPGALGADPNFGKCLQCAALDRARGNITRSPLCAACFTQYCYDANNVTSKAALPGRKLAHVDPDPQGASRVEDFLHDEKGPLIGGVVGLLVLVGALVGGLCVSPPSLSSPHPPLISTRTGSGGAAASSSTSTRACARSTMATTTRPGSSTRSRRRARRSAPRARSAARRTRCTTSEARRLFFLSVLGW
jgi:hypothetical protein